MQVILVASVSCCSKSRFYHTIDEESFAGSSHGVNMRRTLFTNKSCWHLKFVSGALVLVDWCITHVNSVENLRPVLLSTSTFYKTSYSSSLSSKSTSLRSISSSSGSSPSLPSHASTLLTLGILAPRIGLVLPLP